MRDRSDSGLVVSDTGTQRAGEMDSVGTSPVPSTSFDSLLCWGDGISWEGSFSFTDSSLAPDMKGEVLKLPSVWEEANKAVLSCSECVGSAFSGHSSSGPSHIGVEPESLSFSSGLGESLSEVDKPTASQRREALQTKMGPRIRYEIRITLAKENEMAEATSSGGHACGEGALSPGFAEPQETEEQQRHAELARPAPPLSARKEFQNCTGLHGVGTCEVCGQALTCDSANPAAAEEAPLQGGSQARRAGGQGPGPAEEQLPPRDGLLAKGTEILASESPANSFCKLGGISQASSKRELPPERPRDIERGLLPIECNMEKATVSSHRPGRSNENTSFKWKKAAGDSPNQEDKPSPSKAGPHRAERGGSRSQSPSRVSVLLEAWEKGLVGTDALDSPSSTELRRSTSTVHSRRLCFSKEASQPCFPTNAKSPVSPNGDGRRSVSPAGAKRCFSPAENRRPLSPTDPKRSRSPAEARRALSPVNARQTLPTIESRRSFFLEEAKKAMAEVEPRPSFSRAEKRRSRPPSDTRRSPSPARTRRSHSPANARRAPSPSNTRYAGDARSRRSSGDVQGPPSPTEGRYTFSMVESYDASSPSPDTRSLPSVADIRRLYSPGNAKHSADGGPLSSSASTRCSSSLVERRHLSTSTEAKDSSSLSDPKWPFPAAEATGVDAKFSCSLADSKRSPSLNESRSFAPISQCGKRSRSLSPQKDCTTHGPVYAQVYSPEPKPNLLVTTKKKETNDATVSQGENHAGGGGATNTFLERELHIANGSQEENISGIQKNDASNSAGSAPGSFNATNTQPSAGPCVLSPLPRVVSSSTVARSQTQWYSPKSGNMVVYRSERQLIVPQGGTATVYRAGREIVMSSSATGSGSKSKQENTFASRSVVASVPPNENSQPQEGVPETEPPQNISTSFSDACNHTTSSQPESSVTQSRNAGVSDAQRERCTFTSNGDAATTFGEGVAPPRDYSRNIKPVFRTHGSLFAESAMANGTAQDRHASRGEMATLSGGQDILLENKKLTRWTEITEEQRGPRKDPQVFTPQPSTMLAETTTSSQKPHGNSNRAAESEPEEYVDMDLFVDTLRNMGPAECRKALKHLPRSPRLSSLARNTSLPPIHEDHITLRSQVPPASVPGELLAITEEKTSEEREGLKYNEEEATEEIENPYLSMDEHSEDQARMFYPWESRTFRNEEEFGSFLGKLHQGPGDPEMTVMGPNVVLTNQNNMIRSNVLKGVSLLSGLPDKKAADDNKPYSRLDNSLLYSRFISPEKSQFRDAMKGQEMRCPIVLMNPANPKECQVFSSGARMDNAYELRSAELPQPVVRAEPSYRVLGASWNAKEMATRSKATESTSRPDVQPQEESKPVKKVNVRPGKIILYSESGFGGQKREIWGDIPDATSWPLSQTISIRVVRGGWVMYEKPRYYGRKCVLAEGDVEITNPWRIYHKEGEEEEEAEDVPFCIGSLKRVVKDYKLPEISLFSEENGEGTKQRFTDSSEDTRMYSKPLKAASIIVYSGLWLVYSKPYFDDDPYVLEPGGYPSLQAWGAKDSSVCSIHPIKLGCPVVEKAGEPKLVIYEKPHFQGRSWEVSRDIYNVSKPENSQDCKIPTVGSLKIMGGCWVGYEKEGFRGHQYLLEEGEYNDWNQWGGYNDRLMSLRLIRTDFLDPALVLFEAMDFEEGPSIELSEALPDVELANYGTTTQSIHVQNGVWVAYEGKNFSGEQYILEKGVYRNCEDWGANNFQISSVQPILQVGEHSLHFVSKILLFSDADFLGNYISFEEDQPTLPENFVPRSCRVNGGSWILYEGPKYFGEQHVLSEGEYPTLTSMGCLFTTAVGSLKKVPIFFSEPSIFLHGLECFEGKEIELNSEVRSLQAEGFNNHVLSVRVKGGIWVLCEHNDFRGRQWLLNCMEITNWLTYSGLQHIGSLYPIRQKRIYFRLRNEDLDTFLSVPDDVEDMKAGRVLVSELRDSSSSIWYYEDGLLKNQVAPNMSLQVIGPAGSGSKVVLWSESRVPQQTWQIDSYGRICSQMFEDKVVDVKGGNAYDHDHAILWDSSEDRPTQIWHVEVL
ncbi:beta/gamma crystallin domain-containing protein 2 [Anolis carolinensis]|uniref:beta/gamma crystallin domain-containing protein 2 n=1 Tax=Anolis carolinensis TaxID=28377 RepID=UPI002F2B59C0